MKNIVFMGTPSYASKILEEIYKAKFNILAIYTQPDKPVGRSQTLTPPDVKKLAIDLGLNDIVYQPKSLILTCIPKHEPPSFLPPHNIFLGHPHAPAPSMLHPASDIDW